MYDKVSKNLNLGLGLGLGLGLLIIEYALPFKSLLKTHLLHYQEFSFLSLFRIFLYIFINVLLFCFILHFTFLFYLLAETWAIYFISYLKNDFRRFSSLCYCTLNFVLFLACVALCNLVLKSAI